MCGSCQKPQQQGQQVRNAPVTKKHEKLWKDKGNTTVVPNKFIEQQIATKK